MFKNIEKFCSYKNFILTAPGRSMKKIKKFKIFYFMHQPLKYKKFQNIKNVYEYKKFGYYTFFLNFFMDCNMLVHFPLFTVNTCLPGR